MDNAVHPATFHPISKCWSAHMQFYAVMVDFAHKVSRGGECVTHIAWRCDDSCKLPIQRESFTTRRVCLEIGPPSIARDQRIHSIQYTQRAISPHTYEVDEYGALSAVLFIVASQSTLRNCSVKHIFGRSDLWRHCPALSLWPLGNEPCVGPSGNVSAMRFGKRTRPPVACVGAGSSATAPNEQ